MALTPHTPTDRPTACLDAVLLASYVDGRTSPDERASVEAHLARCEDCYFVFAETVRDRQARAKKSRWRYWVPRAAAGLATAAALVVAVISLTSDSSSPPPPLVLRVALNELDAAAGPYRVYEPRVTFLPTHYQLEPATRSDPRSRETPPTLRVAAAMVEKAAGSATTVEERRALATAYLAQGQPTRAVEVISPLAASANEPGLLNDIAAAYLARGAAGDAQQAFDLLERAVNLDPAGAEAWFNLGLAAEALGHVSRAREAWTRYLVLDPSSEWAAESRRHLAQLTR
jgi:tetratricopeptide (TPR) repeat protein